MTFTLHYRLFLYLVLGFILATIVGTVSHELGHIAVGKMQGYETELYYDSASIIDAEGEKKLETFYEENKDKILSDPPLYPEEKAMFTKMLKEGRDSSILSVMGGPIQTTLTGTIGFLLLWFNRKKIGSSLTVLQWIFVFLAFFWSRQLFNLLTGILYYLLSGEFGHSDETSISMHYQWKIWTVDIIGSSIAVVVLSIVVFRLIPKQQRFTFLCAGVVGSAVGFIFWMRLLGPVILP